MASSNDGDLQTESIVSSAFAKSLADKIASQGGVSKALFATLAGLVAVRETVL
jgi:hypothetical protein